MKLKLLVVSLAILFFGTGVSLLTKPTYVYAQFSNSSKEAACKGITGTTGSDSCANDNAASGLNKVIATVLNIFSIIIGIIAVIMVMVGGVKYTTSSGDAQKAANARSTILYAIVGLIVAAMAQVIVRFVLNRLR